MIQILLELPIDCDRVPGKINVTCQIKAEAFTDSQTSKITDHERQIITCAVKMILNVFPFLTSTNMLNTHLSTWIHRNLRRSCKRTWIGLQIFAWVDRIF